MPYEYSADVLIAAHEALLDILDGGTGPARLVLKDDGGVTLSTIPMTEPAGSVDETTGQLTLTPDGRDESAAATGDADTAELQDGDGITKLTMPCQQGVAPIPGVCVMTSVSITEGDPVEVGLLVVG